MKRDISIQLAALLQDKYGLSNPLVEKPKGGIEGNTYIITAGNQRYAAKVYDSEKQASTSADYQNAVYKANAPVPAIVKTQINELIATLTDQYVVLCEFAHGRPMGWCKEFAEVPSQLSHEIAQALAKMHHIGQNIAAAKLGHALSASQRLDDFRGDDVLEFLLPYNLTTVRQTIVHGDLTRENIFVNPATSNLTAIIDFGDAHHDYITYDIATTLTHIYVTKSWGIDFDGINDFLTAYTRYISLTQTERQTIFPFMMLRNMILLREIQLRVTQDCDDHEDLGSIRQSLHAKLCLLKEHSFQLKNILEEKSSHRYLSS